MLFGSDARECTTEIFIGLPRQGCDFFSVGESGLHCTLKICECPFNTLSKERWPVPLFCGPHQRREPAAPAQVTRDVPSVVRPILPPTLRLQIVMAGITIVLGEFGPGFVTISRPLRQ